MTFDDFEQQAAARDLVQLRRELYADLLTPVAAYLMLRRKGVPAFLLETVEQHEALGRYSFVGLDPLFVVTARGRRLTITSRAGREEREGNLFGLMQELADGWTMPAQGEGFEGGLVGYVGYDAVQHLEQVPVPTAARDDEPDAILGMFVTIVRFDHRYHRATLTHHVRIDRARGLREQYDEGMALLEALQLRLRGLPVSGHFTWTPPADTFQDEQRYCDGVRRAREAIRDGEIFQVVLSRRVTAPFSGDPFAVYRALRMINPSPYLFFLEFGETSLIGSSPESLVRVRDGIVDVLPIAGTRRRGADDAEDRLREAELLADAKENAEHLMLVDLGRNDVGRVARFGTVEVPVFRRVDRYSHVMHLVSQVRGRLRPGCTAVDALRACFPAGTVSGAPKVRAMEIIAELEGVRRGVYAGGVGYAGFDGSLDTCIAIRTIVAHRERLKFQAGAGIVADSDPQREFQETVSKMQVLMEAARLAAGGIAPTAVPATKAHGS